MTDPRRFTPTPSIEAGTRRVVRVDAAIPSSATAIGVPMGSTGDVPSTIGLVREVLSAAGFQGAPGTALTLPDDGAVIRIATGIGDPSTADAATFRAAGAAFARAAAGHARLALVAPSMDSVGPLVEGALLSRYRYDVLRSSTSAIALEELTIVVADAAAARDGLARAVAFANATMLARDLANTPHSHLSASGFGEVAVAVGAASGLEVEVVERDALVAMGIGGLLGVNAGSAEPPVMVRLRYLPTGGEPVGRLALVGKGIMYDAGGIAIKPGDAVHAQMKNDMSGAAAILAAMSVLGALGCRSEVTGYLMCTDNMPSSTAMALGDVITIRGGTTVEVVNTDAEGRLVMADALVLAREAGTNDAIVDIATLTGAMMRALGREVAGVIGNDQPLVDRILAAGDQTGEPVWQLPLHQGYRGQLSSSVADMKNLGWGDGGAITAALFLAEFVGDTPWAHIDIAGTAQSEGDRGWMTDGCTGFGARLLLRLALDFDGSRV